MRAGLPTTVPGMSIDRQCASGMMAIGAAAKQILHDGMDIVVGGGLELVSLVQNEHMNRYPCEDPGLVEFGAGDVHVDAGDGGNCGRPLRRFARGAR